MKKTFLLLFGLALIFGLIALSIHFSRTSLSSDSPSKAPAAKQSPQNQLQALQRDYAYYHDKPLLAYPEKSKFLRSLLTELGKKDPLAAIRLIGEEERSDNLLINKQDRRANSVAVFASYSIQELQEMHQRTLALVTATPRIQDYDSQTLEQRLRMAVIYRFEDEGKWDEAERYVDSVTPHERTRLLFRKMIEMDRKKMADHVITP